MLQTYNAPSVVAERGASMQVILPPPGKSSPADMFATVVGFIRRQFLVVISVLPLTLGLAAAYLYTTPRLYSAQASILINTGKVQVFKQSILGDDPVNMAMVDSLTEVLKSDSFALSIINKLRLDQDPEFVGSPGFITQAANRILHPFAGNKPKSDTDFINSALRVFEHRLTIARLGMTYVIEVGFQSTNPERAAQIANAVATAFILDQVDAKYQAIARTTAWLRDRMDELRPQVVAAEYAIMIQKTQNNIVDSGGHLINEQQISELNTALVKARADTVEARARLDQVSQIQIARISIQRPQSWQPSAETVQHGEIISRFRQQYLEARATRGHLLTNRLGPNHLAVVNLRKPDARNSSQHCRIRSSGSQTCRQEVSYEYSQSARSIPSNEES